MTIFRGIAFTAAVISGLTLPAAHAQLLPTTGSVASGLGPLELVNGYPTDATVAKVFDDIDFQRACQAYLWALPLMAMQQHPRSQCRSAHPLSTHQRSQRCSQPSRPRRHPQSSP